MATIEELQEQIAALSARVDALTVPPNRYYSSRYTGETIDKLLTSISGGAANLDLSNLTDYQRALHNIGGRPGKNLVKNWFFGGGGSQLGFGFSPINQRGLTEYVQDLGAGNAYGPDNWVLEAGSSIALKSTHMEFSTGANAITQPETKEFLDKLVGKQVTVSCLTLENELATATGVVKDFSQNTGINALFSGGSFAFVVFPNVAVQVGRWAGSGNIVACKVEEGPVQTLSYKDHNGIWRLFETTEYGEELARCQQNLLALNNLARYRAISIDTNTIDFFIPTPVTMRATPVLQSFSATIFPFNSSSGVSGFSFSVIDKSSNGIYLRATKTAHGLTDARINIAAGSLLSAEL